MSRLPNLGGDNGSWGSVLLDWALVEHAGDGTHVISLPAAAAFRYVDPAGSDSNSGLAPGKAKATLQAAYDALPATGGSVVLLPGRHNVGSGFVAASAQKPCVFTSLTGYSPITRAPVVAPTTYLTQPVIYGSGATLMKVSSGAGIANGWAWLGLSFDMSTSGNLYGIWAEDVNGGRVRDCMAEATHSEAAYLVRTTSPLFDDCSQWRIEDNYVRNMGLCTMNDGATDGNCNNNQVLNNCIFGGLTGGAFVVKLAVASRCLVMGNEVAMSGSTGFVRYLSTSHYNHTLFNGGEGSYGPFIQYDSGAYANIEFNYGTTGGAATGSEVLLNDLDADNTLAAGSYSLAKSASGMATFTADYTLASSNWWGQMLNMNKATAITLTVPLQANAGIQIGSSLKVRQGGAGQVTIAPAGGVTIRSKTGGLKTAAQYGVIELRKVDVNEWTAWGDTTPTSGATGSNGYFNVKDYGATGDGTTDDKAAIQAAIDAVTDVAGVTGGAGGVVLFPPGRYRISAGLTTSTRSIALQGIGAGLGASVALGKGAIQILQDNSAFVGFTFNPSGALMDQGPVIRDLQFVAAGSSCTGAVRIRNANNFKLDNVGMVDYSGGYGFLTECTSVGGNQYGQFLTPHIHTCATGIKTINSNGLRVIGGSIEGWHQDTSIPTSSRGIWVSGTGSDTLCVLGTVIQACDFLVDIEGGSGHQLIGIRGELMKTTGFKLASTFGTQISGGSLVNSDSLASTGTGITIASSCTNTQILGYPMTAGTLATDITDSDDSTVYPTRLYKTAGDPGGVVSGYPGDLCIRTSGGPPWFYFKETGAGTTSGWVSRQA